MLKRIAVIAAAIALCTSAPVGAQVESYPPDTSSLTLNAPACNPGSISGTVFGVLPGSTATITAQLPGGAGESLLRGDRQHDRDRRQRIHCAVRDGDFARRFGTATVAATGTSAVGDPFTLQAQLELVPCAELPIDWIRSLPLDPFRPGAHRGRRRIRGRGGASAPSASVLRSAHYSRSAIVFQEPSDGAAQTLAEVYRRLVPEVPGGGRTVGEAVRQVAGARRPEPRVSCHSQERLELVEEFEQAVGAPGSDVVRLAGTHGGRCLRGRQVGGDDIVDVGEVP